MQNYLASDKEEEQGGGIYGYCVCHMGEVITMNRENDILGWFDWFNSSCSYETYYSRE